MRSSKARNRATTSATSPTLISTTRLVSIRSDEGVGVAADDDGTHRRRSAAAPYAATSSMVLYGLASFSAIRSLMTGHAGSISDLPLLRQLNFGLRGCPWWLLCRPSPPVSNATSRTFVAVLLKFLSQWQGHTPLMDEDRQKTYIAAWKPAASSPHQSPSTEHNSAVPIVRPSQPYRNTWRSHQPSSMSRAYRSITSGVCAVRM